MYTDTEYGSNILRDRNSGRDITTQTFIGVKLMSNRIIKALVRLSQIAALTLAGATAAYAYPANCPSGATGQPTLCSSCHSSLLSPSKSDYNGGCFDLSGTTTTTTSSTGSTTTSSSGTTTTSSTSSTTDISSDTDTEYDTDMDSDTDIDTEEDSDSESHKHHKKHKDHKEHKRHTWLDAAGSRHANEHSRFFRDPHDNRLHRIERD